MNPKDAQFSAPLKWLAVHKETGEHMTFYLRDVEQHKDGSGCVGGFVHNIITYRRWRLDDCYLCGSTGYIDSEKEKVYEGHVCKRVCHGAVMHTEAIGVIEWHDYSWVWRCGTHIIRLGDIPSRELTIIAHIRIPSELSKILSDSEVPDEVRRLLE